MQQRNFVLWLILSMTVLIGWVFVQNQLWPPGERKPKQPPPAKVDTVKVDLAKAWVWDKLAAAHQSLILSSLLADRLPGAGPMAEPWRLALDLGLPGRWEKVELKKEEVQAKPKEQPKPEPVERVTLGGPKYHLEAVLTTRGAGLEKLILTKFKAADWLGRPTDSALNLVQEDPILPAFLMYHYADKDDSQPVSSLGEMTWKLEDQQSDPDGAIKEARFSAIVPDANLRHLTIFKTFRLEPGEYHITLTLEIRDGRKGTGEAKAVRYQLAGGHGLPIEGEWYSAVTRSSVICMFDKERLAEDAHRISSRQGGDPQPASKAGGIQFAGVMNQYFASLIVVDNKQPTKDAGGVDTKNILAWARPTLESSERKGRIFKLTEDSLSLTATDKEGGNPVFQLLDRTKKHIKDLELTEGQEVIVYHYQTDNGQRVATWIRPGKEPHPNFDDITVRVNSKPVELVPGQRVVHQFLLYHGPVKTALLGQFTGDKSVDPDLVDRYTHILNLKMLTDYGSYWLWGLWTDLLIACTKVMHWLLNILHFLVPNYGLTIILLTVVVRGLMFPISRKQALLSMKMQALAPEMKKLQEKYKNDAKARTEATMELYRKHQVHPLGGCLPLLLQMPIFLGLYYALMESVQFRLAGFLWIRNLAAPDMLVWWGESIPWISDPDSQGGVFYLGPYFNLLPIFAVGFMLAQQKLMMPPPVDEQQAMQHKMMKYMMIFFGIMFYKVASGLCLYFIASSMWGLAERKLLPKKREAGAAAGTAAPPPPPPGKGGKPKPGPGKKKDKDKDDDSALQKVKDWWSDVLKQAKKK